MDTIDSPRSRAPPQALRRTGRQPGDWNQSSGGPGVKVQVQVCLEPGLKRAGIRVGLARANERAAGGTRYESLAFIVWERGRFTHQGPIRGGQIERTGPRCTGPDPGGTGSRPCCVANRGLCLQLGEVRVVLARSLDGSKMGGRPMTSLGPSH